MLRHFNPLNWFQVDDSQRSRISVSWMVGFFYRLSFMLGWTVITAIFVNRIGIESLPFLFIGNALLMMCGTMIFSELIRFIQKEILIICTLLIAAITLFVSATFLLPWSETAFLITSIVGISLFLGQINILVQLFIEDLFTPIESETAFPLIETSETIGGIAAGVILTSLGTVIAPYKFLYILIIISLCIIPTIGTFRRTCHNDLPNLNLKKREKLKEISKLKRIEEGWAEIKRTGFLQGIVVVVLCQFIIFNLVEFQYTKAVQQKVYNAHERTILLEDHLVEEVELASLYPETTYQDQALFEARNEAELEKELTYTLGFLQAIISAFALATQLFVASEIIKKLGIVQSLLIHPLMMLANFSIMALRFTMGTAFVARTGFEMTRSVFQTAYLSSYYSLQEEVREEIKEFMEGIVTPIGAIIGTALIFLFQYLLNDHNITLGLNITMISIAFVMAYVIYSLQKEYTKVSSKALRVIDNTPDKLNSIEILSQKGHKKAVYILLKTLENPTEKSIVKIKVLEALGRMTKKRAIPSIIKCLESSDARIQTAAVEALAKYEKIDQHFFNNAFARHRMSEALKKLFEKPGTIEAKASIIKILAKINKHDVVEYLINLLETSPMKIKIDCVRVIGFFHDPSSVSYIEKFLDSSNINLQCATMKSLWQYGIYRQEYRSKILEKIRKLLRSKKQNELISTLGVIGSLELVQFEAKVQELVASEDKAVREAALKALIQLEHREAIKPFVELLLSSRHTYKHIKKYLEDDRMSKKFKKKIEFEINRQVSKRIHEIFLNNNDKIIEEFDVTSLKSLKHLYSLIEKDREVLKISEIMENSVKARSNKPRNLATT